MALYNRFSIYRTNNSFLIWKRDSNREEKQSSIHLRQVEKDGISFRDDWQSVALLVANYTTEKRVIEGPWMVYRLVLLFFKYI